MENPILFILVILLFSACKNDDTIELDAPDCIETIINADAQNGILRTVKKQLVDEQFYYWLNTGDMELDGIEYVVNTECDTICSLGGFIIRPTPCTCCDFENWEVIWEMAWED